MKASELQRRSITESISPEKISRIQEFVKFCFKKLRLSQKPRIKLTNKVETTALGYFVPETNTIVAVVNGRHQMDIMRTLAHELVHLKQSESRPLDGSTGSPDENEANAMAGVLLRVWGQLHPEYFVEDRKFTDLEIAIMEGGSSIQDDRTFFIKKQLEQEWKEKMRVREIIESTSPQLDELFQQPAPWNWTSPMKDKSSLLRKFGRSSRVDTNLITANFKIKNSEYTWTAEPGEESRSTWIIDFKEQDHGYGISGTGNAAQVFSTVIDITNQFIKKTGAKTLVFSAVEPSRKKLYLSLVRRLLPNWGLTQSGVLFIVKSPNARDDDEEAYEEMKISEIIENSKRQLSELFREPADWRWEYPLKAGSNQAIATFEVGKHEYTWLANRSDVDWGEWTIEFEENTLGHGVTGTGNAATVFSTVVAITDLFIRRSNAYTLVFSSKEPSRTKLYLSMVRRLLPTWKLTQDGNVITVQKPDVLSSNDDKTVGESASAGATSTANIGTVVNPHISPGPSRGKKSYLGSPWGGKSGTKSPPQPKVVQPKNPDGTAKGAHDIKGASLFGGPAIKR